MRLARPWTRLPNLRRPASADADRLDDHRHRLDPFVVVIDDADLRGMITPASVSRRDHLSFVRWRHDQGLGGLGGSALEAAFIRCATAVTT